MITSLLVTLDGSAFAERGLGLAGTVAMTCGARVELLAVAEPLPGVALELSPSGSDVSAHLTQQVERAGAYLNDVRARFVEAFPELDPTIVTESGANPAGVILEHARTSKIDLVVATSHGRGPLARAWLGSVATDLLRHTTVPLLVVRPDEEEAGRSTNERGIEPGPQIQSILVPLDQTVEAEVALEPAASLAAASGASLTLLHINPTTAQLVAWGLANEASVPLSVDPDAAPSDNASRDRLEAHAKDLRAHGIDVAIEVVAGSSPSREILAWCEHSAPDLIVMATQGGGSLVGLLGSVADKVVRSANVPVIACPIPNPSD